MPPVPIQLLKLVRLLPPPILLLRRARPMPPQPTLLLRLALLVPLRRPIQGIAKTLPEQYDTANYPISK